jgi:hypothetical protein
MSFTPFDPLIHSSAQLVSSLLSAGPALSINPASITLRYGRSDVFDETLLQVVQRSSLSFYDGSILGLGLGSGLLLTTGDSAPPRQNSSDSYGWGFSEGVGGLETDLDLQQVANSAFAGAGTVEDTTVLSFDLNVTDANIRGVRFNLVFGSEEFPEFLDTEFVDIGAVFVNGTNYALFNGQANQPLSIIGENVAAGNMISNESGGANIGLEYDGVSRVLSVVAPVQQGLNTIKIGVADTGDSIYDSGLFVSGLQGVNYSGFGLAPVVVPINQSTTLDASGNQLYQFQPDSTNVIQFSTTPGDDVVDAQNSFVTAQFNLALSQIVNYSYVNQVLQVQTPFGNKQLSDVERVELLNGYFAFDSNPGENTWEALMLLRAGFGSIPNAATLGKWVAEADKGVTMSQLASQMLNFYAPGVTATQLIPHLFGTLAGVSPTQTQVNIFAGEVGLGKTWNTLGELFAYAAQLPINTDALAGLVGGVFQLDQSFF